MQLQFHLSVLPVLFATNLAMVVALLWLATRRRLRLDLPTCAACGRDLRPVAADFKPTCPACGRQLLVRGAVHFPQAPLPWRRLLAPSLILALLPVWPTIYWKTQPAPMRLLPPRAVALAFPTPPLPDWYSIRNDAKEGRISPTQALTYLTRANDEISQALATDPHWWSHGLFEAIGALLQANLITQEECEPVIKTMVQGHIQIKSQPAVRAGNSIRIVGKFHGLGHDETWYTFLPRGFREDGRAFSPVQLSHGLPSLDTFELLHSLTPGEHQLVLVCDQVLQSGGKKFTFPCEFPMSLYVSAADQSPIMLIKDPELTRAIMQSVQLRACFVSPLLSQDCLQLKWDVAQGPKVPVFCFDVFVVIGAEQFDCGRISSPAFGYFADPENQSFRLPFPVGKHLPANLRTATVRLVPNVEKTEMLFGASRLPAEPIVIRNVPLDRYDLDETWATTRPSTTPWRP